MLPPVSSPTRMAIHQIDKRLNKLAADREVLVRKLASEDGFKPCGDCFNGYCSMNCSSAPIYMKVLI